jgi:MarR family transcriptional regulator, organic hydroperoxide resistance regulator
MSKNSNELSLGYAIGKTNWYLKTLINKLLREEECSITNEQWLVLKVIDANPGMSQTEVAEKSQKEKTNITRILDLLEKSGCIERRKDERDRRYYRIHATDEGENVLKTVNPITEKTEEICTQSLSRKQIKEMIALLERVCDSVKKQL